MSWIKGNNIIETLPVCHWFIMSLSKSEDHGPCFGFILSSELDSILITCKWLRKVSHDVIFIGTSWISSLIVEVAQ